MVADPSSAQDPRAGSPSALPPGTRLGEFELLKVLGIGGFGIVYLALDHDLEREVAVKEYMPASLAGRTETLHVSLRSKSDADTFALGLKSFVNEAKLLARFDHPSLLKVHRFWEANGTAYMAMPVLRGRTVKEVRQEMSAPPDEAWLRALLDPLLGAIERLHGEGVYHRDIAPDNIQIEPDGRPVLLDFGAARRVISDKSQALTAILKPAYAPIEQYAEAGSVRQGPWTDLYALGATLHYLLLLRPPPPATARAVHDDALPLAGMQLSGCSENFLQIVDWMLAPRPSDRPQRVPELRDALDGRTLPPRRRAEPAPAVSQWEQTVVLPPAAAAAAPARDDDPATRIIPPSRPVPPTGPAAATGPVSGVLKPPVSAPVSPPSAPAARPAPAPLWAPTTMPAAAAAKRSWALPALLGIATVGVVAAAVSFWPRPAPVTASAEAASSPAAMAPAVQRADPAPVVTPAPAPVSTVAAPVAEPAAVAKPEPAPAPVQAEVQVPAPTPAALPATATSPKVTAPPAVAEVASRPVRAAPAVAPRLPAGTAATPSEPTPKPREPARQPVAAGPSYAAPSPYPPAGGAVAPAAAPPAAETPKAVAVGPESKCAGRNPISYFACMERECWRSEFLSHPDCLAWRKDARRN